MSLEIGIIIFLGVWLLGLTAFVVSLQSKYKKVLSGVKAEPLDKVLESHIERVNKVNEQNSSIQEKLNELDQFSNNYLYKKGFKRFNPFQNTGGDQSFVLALLDSKDNGFVISSMYSRDGSRIFAKPVVEGKEGSYKFSDVELEVIEEAIQNKFTDA